MDPVTERLVEALLQAIRDKLLARKGTVAESQKLVIEVYRRDGEIFDISLTSKTR